MLRWVRGEISLAHRVEHFVAKVTMQQLVVVAHGLDQPRTVGVLVDAEQHFTFFLRAVEDFRQNQCISGQDAALEVVLLLCEVAHPACRPRFGKTVAATSRVRLTSTSNSSSGGMLSSRSMIVDIWPKLLSA